MQAAPALIAIGGTLLSRAISSGGGGGGAANRVPVVPSTTGEGSSSTPADRSQELETERRRAVVLAQQGTGRGATLLGTGVSSDGRLRSTLG